MGDSDGPVDDAGRRTGLRVTSPYAGPPLRDARCVRAPRPLQSGVARLSRRCRAGRGPRTRSGPVAPARRRSARAPDRRDRATPDHARRAAPAGCREAAAAAVAQVVDSATRVSTPSSNVSGRQCSARSAPTISGQRAGTLATAVVRLPAPLGDQVGAPSRRAARGRRGARAAGRPARRAATTAGLARDRGRARPRGPGRARLSPGRCRTAAGPGPGRRRRQLGSPVSSRSPKSSPDTARPRRPSRRTGHPRALPARRRAPPR